MPTNFLSDWTEFTSGTEAPDNYFTWSGISALSAMVGRRVWLPYGRFVFYPNLYVVLLGPPSNGKTTAMAFAKNLVRELQLPFSAECQTKESLVKEMATYERVFDVAGRKLIHTPINIFVTELSHFLGPNSGHMIDFLTTVFDQDVYDTKTKGKGNDLITGPAVNLLGCTTPEWITTYLKGDIISGGFTRRALFVNEFESPHRIPFPTVSDVQKKAADRFRAHAKILLSVAGEFRWDNATMDSYRQWYTTLQLPNDPTIRSYFRFKHGQVMKVAMLVALAETPELILRKHHFELTLALFEKIEVNLPKVFQGMGRNELNQVGGQLMDLLRLNNGVLPEKEVMKALIRDANTAEILSVMGHLEKTEQIVRLQQVKAGVTRIFICLPSTAEQLRRSSSGPPSSQQPDKTG